MHTLSLKVHMHSSSAALWNDSKAMSTTLCDAVSSLPDCHGVLEFYAARRQQGGAALCHITWGNTVAVAGIAYIAVPPVNSLNTRSCKMPVQVLHMIVQDCTTGLASDYRAGDCARCSHNVTPEAVTLSHCPRCHTRQADVLSAPVQKS